MTKQENLGAKLDGMGIPALGTLRVARDGIDVLDTRAQDAIDDIAEAGGSAVAADTRMAHRLIGLGIGTVVIHDQAPAGQTPPDQSASH